MRIQNRAFLFFPQFLCIFYERFMRLLFAVFKRDEVSESIKTKIYLNEFDKSLINLVKRYLNVAPPTHFPFPLPT